MNERTCGGCATPVPTGDAHSLARWAVVSPRLTEVYCPNCLTPGEAARLSAAMDQLVEEETLLHRLREAGRDLFFPDNAQIARAG
jgi:hypothetical protein